MIKQTNQMQLLFNDLFTFFYLANFLKDGRTNANIIIIIIQEFI